MCLQINLKKIMRKEERVIKYFSQKELKKIFSAIENTKENNRFWLRDLTIFNLAYLCWMRASEVWMLKLENFNSQSWEIFVRRLKNSLNNTIRLDNDRKKLLSKYIKEYWIKEQSDFLFISRNKIPISWITITYLMQKYSELVKWISTDKLHFHTLKHSIAVHLAESGATLQEIREYLGHKRIESTLCYFSYTTSQQEAFYKKISENNRLV